MFGLDRSTTTLRPAPSSEPPKRSPWDSMAERIDQFVALFPIHPAYIERFELISVAEKLSTTF